jgi:uncharacterized protein YbaR (Trm112 family)
MTDERNPSEPAAPRRDDAETVDPRLLEILVCPVTRSTLRYDATRQELVSQSAHVAFPIRGGVPVMITDEARAI